MNGKKWAKKEGGHKGYLDNMNIFTLIFLDMTVLALEKTH